MLKKELFELIDERIEVLSKPYNKFNDFDEVKKCLENNPHSSYEEIRNIDIWEILAAILCCLDKEKTVSEFKKILEPLRLYLDRMSTKDSSKFVDNLLDVLNKEEMYEKFKKEVRGSRFKAPDTPTNMDDYRDYINAYKSLLDITEGNEDTIDILIIGLMHYKFTQYGFTKYDEYMKTKTNSDSRELKRKIKRAVSSKMNDLLYLPQGIELITILERYVNFIEDEERKTNKQRIKESKGLINAKKLLEIEIDKDEIKNYKYIVDGIRDENMKKLILYFIYEHNMKYYSDLEYELDTLKEDKTIKYRSIFKSLGINTTEDIIKLIVDRLNNDIDNILEILKKLDLTSDEYLKILTTTNIETVNIIKQLIDKGYITKIFIKNNIDIFNSNSNKLNILIDNIKVLETYNINPMILNNNNLLINENYLKYNISILNDYDLIKSIKTTSNYKFLELNNLNDKIDLLIELGYYKLLELDLNILNYDNYNRLELLRLMNYEIESIDELNNLLSSTKFIISDDNIDSYISDLVSLKDEVELDISIDDLESYRIDDRTYSINGIIISSKKVERKLKEGNSIYKSITHNKRMNKDEYDELLDTLTLNTRR